MKTPNLDDLARRLGAVLRDNSGGMTPREKDCALALALRLMADAKRDADNKLRSSPIAVNRKGKR